jgi:hypothetical protein
MQQKGNIFIIHYVRIVQLYLTVVYQGFEERYSHL